MADDTILQNIQISGTDQVATDLSRLAVSGELAFKKLREAADQLSKVDFSQFDSLKPKLETIGQSAEKTGGSFRKFGDDAASSAGKAEGAFSSLEKKIIGIAAGYLTLSSIINTYNKIIESSTKFGSDVQNTAEAAGISPETLQVLRAQVDDTDALDKALKKLKGTLDSIGTDQTIKYQLEQIKEAFVHITKAEVELRFESEKAKEKQISNNLAVLASVNALAEAKNTLARLEETQGNQARDNALSLASKELDLEAAKTNLIKERDKYYASGAGLKPLSLRRAEIAVEQADASEKDARAKKERELDDAELKRQEAIVAVERAKQAEQVAITKKNEDAALAVVVRQKAEVELFKAKEEAERERIKTIIAPTGVKPEDLAGKDTEEKRFIFAEALNKIGDAQKKAAEASKFFGPEYQKVLNLAKEGLDVWRNGREAIKGFSDEQVSAAEESLNAATGAIPELEAALKKYGSAAKLTAEDVRKLGDEDTDASKRLSILGNALGRITDPAERASLALKFLGGEEKSLGAQYEKFITLSRGGEKALTEGLNPVRKVGKEGTEALNDLSNATDELGKAFDLIKNKVGAFLAPTATSKAKWLTEILADVDKLMFGLDKADEKKAGLFDFKSLDKFKDQLKAIGIDLDSLKEGAKEFVTEFQKGLKGEDPKTKVGGIGSDAVTGQKPEEGKGASWAKKIAEDLKGIGPVLAGVTAAAVYFRREIAGLFVLGQVEKYTGLLKTLLEVLGALALGVTVVTRSIEAAYFAVGIFVRTLQGIALLNPFVLIIGSLILLIRYGENLTTVFDTLAKFLNRFLEKFGDISGLTFPKDLITGAGLLETAIIALEAAISLKLLKTAGSLIAFFTGTAGAAALLSRQLTLIVGAIALVALGLKQMLDEDFQKKAQEQAKDFQKKAQEQAKDLMKKLGLGQDDVSREEALKGQKAAQERAIDKTAPGADRDSLIADLKKTNDELAQLGTATNENTGAVKENTIAVKPSDKGEKPKKEEEKSLWQMLQDLIKTPILGGEVAKPSVDKKDTLGGKIVTNPNLGSITKEQQAKADEEIRLRGGGASKAEGNFQSNIKNFFDEMFQGKPLLPILPRSESDGILKSLDAQSIILKEMVDKGGFGTVRPERPTERIDHSFDDFGFDEEAWGKNAEKVVTAIKRIEDAFSALGEKAGVRSNQNDFLKGGPESKNIDDRRGETEADKKYYQAIEDEKQILERLDEELKSGNPNQLLTEVKDGISKSASTEADLITRSESIDGSVKSSGTKIVDALDQILAEIKSSDKKSSSIMVTPGGGDLSPDHGLQYEKSQYEPGGIMPREEGTREEEGFGPLKQDTSPGAKIVSTTDQTPKVGAIELKLPEIKVTTPPPPTGSEPITNDGLNKLIDTFKTDPSVNDKRGISDDTLKRFQDIMRPRSEVDTDQLKETVGSLTDDFSKVAEALSSFGDASNSAIDALRKLADAGSSFTEAAGGGYITGPGTGTSDSIPAMLSNKEGVITADATEHYGGKSFIDSVNAKRFNLGGIVGVGTNFFHAVNSFADGGFVGGLSDRMSNLLPRFAAGGIVNQPTSGLAGLHPVTINFEGRKVANVYAPGSAVREMRAASVSSQISSTGRKPQHYR